MNLQQLPAKQLTPCAVFRAVGGISKMIVTGREGLYITVTRVADSTHLRFTENYLYANFEYLGHMRKFVQTTFTFRANKRMTVTVTDVQGKSITYRHNTNKTYNTVTADQFKVLFNTD